MVQQSLFIGFGEWIENTESVEKTSKNNQDRLSQQKNKHLWELKWFSLNLLTTLSLLLNLIQLLYAYLWRSEQMHITYVIPNNCLFVFFSSLCLFSLATCRAHNADHFSSIGFFVLIITVFAVIFFAIWAEWKIRCANSLHEWQHVLDLGTNRLTD